MQGEIGRKKYRSKSVLPQKSSNAMIENKLTTRIKINFITMPKNRIEGK